MLDEELLDLTETPSEETHVMKKIVRNLASLNVHPQQIEDV